MTSIELSGEIFAVWHSSYAVSKFKPCRPSERGENGWEHFLDEREMNIKKDNENSRPLNLVHISCTLGIHGGYQCVAQLSFSRAVVFFLLFAAVFSRDDVRYVLKMLKLA